MEFTEGQVVIHPQHGTATVVDIEEREVAGVERRYVVLRRTQDDLELRVPLDTVDDIGIRAVMDATRVGEIMKVLRQQAQELSRSWHKRRAHNEERMRSGDPTEVAAVVRDLVAYDREYGMPPTDRRMYDEARQRIVREVALARDADEDAVSADVDDALGIERNTEDGTDTNL